MSLPSPNGLFDRLPVELRLKVWTALFSFANPLRFHQHIPGSPDLSILRTNRQLHHETINVLFAQNAILVTRSDFCRKTNAALKSPVPYEHIRHLVVGSFCESLQCFYYPTQCPPCKYPGIQFLEVLREMPRLKTVVVDYHAHTKLFAGLCDALKSSTAPKLTCLSLGYYELSNTTLGGVDISFQNGPLVRTWPVLREMYARQPTRQQAAPVLDALSTEYEHVTALWCLLLESKNPGHHGGWFGRLSKNWWVDEDDLARVETDERSRKLALFTSGMQECLEFEAAGLCRNHRDDEEVMTEH